MTECYACHVTGWFIPRASTLTYISCLKCRKLTVEVEHFSSGNSVSSCFTQKLHRQVRIRWAAQFVPRKWAKINKPLSFCSLNVTICCLCDKNVCADYIVIEIMANSTIAQSLNNKVKFYENNFVNLILNMVQQSAQILCSFFTDKYLLKQNRLRKDVIAHQICECVFHQ